MFVVYIVISSFFYTKKVDCLYSNCVVSKIGEISTTSLDKNPIYQFYRRFLFIIFVVQINKYSIFEK